MKREIQCCDIETACGRNLWQGVVFVGIATLVISAVVLISSVGFVITMAVSDLLYNNQPVMAVDLVLALVSTSVSSYQIVISLLLLWQAYRNKNKIYLCSLWYVSHLSILTLYGILFTSKTIVCFMERQYGSMTLSIILGIAYQAVYTYFAIIVNSYLHSLDEDRYL